MSDKMKSPKKNNDKIFNNDVEHVLIGLMMILLSLIGLLNNGPVGNFLTYISIYLFGAYYFILYALVIALAIYMMVKRKLYKIHINMKILGGLLVFLSLLIASSSTSAELRVNNLTTIFNEHMASVSSSIFVIDNISNLATTGGGFIGFTLRALLNTCVTNIGTTIVYIVCMTVGLIILFKDVIAYLIKFFANYKYKHKKEVQSDNVEDVISRTEKKEEFIDRLNLESNIISEPLVAKEQPLHVEEVEEEYKEPESVYPPVGKLASSSSKPIEIKSFFIDDLEEEEVKEEVIKETPLPKVIPFEESPAVEEIDDLEEEEVIKETPIVQPQSTFEKKEVKSFEIKSDIIKNPNKINNNEPKPVKKVKYVLPPFDLLKYHATEDTKYENERVAQQRLEKINQTFAQYKIGAQVISYTIGPSVTRFNVKMNEGIRVNTLSSISNEISIALNGNKTVRLDLVVEGRDTSSIEVGNEKPTAVSFKECFEQIKDRNKDEDKLLIPLGKDIEGRVITTSMDELPHLLVAGTTGSGKSVFINTIISTFIMRNTPDELKLMLIDPKKVEFSKYANLPHLLCPIITDAKDGKEALKRLVQEMERRYEMLSEKGAAKIAEYNEFAEIQGFEKMPNIVLVCDEFSDFMSEHGKEIEQSVKRLAQKARACGIYLIICTQRPSVSVITGDIKAVIPSRIGLLVPQYVDSKTILDDGGAESLLGNGDMLCRIPKRGSLVRVQGAYISGSEILTITQYIKNQMEVQYDENFLNLTPQVNNQFVGAGDRRKELDPLHEEVKKYVIQTRIASTSRLQSQYGIGYARADHILNCLEDEGILQRVNGNRRIVIAKAEDSEAEEENFDE